MKKKFVLLSLIFFSASSEAIPVLWQIQNGVSLPITAHGVCKIVANATGATITVDTYTTTTWSNYRNAPPTNVTISDCPTTAPSFINMQFANMSGSTSCTVNKPTGLAVGDLMITTMYDASDISTVTAPSGFTLLNGPNTIGASSYRETRHYKIATAGDVASSTFSFTRGTAFSDCGVTIAAFRNVNQTTPIAGQTWNNSTGTATVTFLGITATTANSISVAISESTDISTPALISTYSDIGEVVTQYLRWQMKVIPAGATGNITTTMGAPGTSSATHIVINPM